MMKKIATIVMLISVMMCACSQNKSVSVSSPHEICVDNRILSYYDDITDFENAGMKICRSVGESVKSKQSNVFVGKENEICYILIVDNNISTYKGISVGDSEEVIKEKFQYENVSANYAYDVTFDKEKEVKYNDSLSDDCIRISYYVNSGIIEKIQIINLLYARK